jgi:hypothetical protein
MGERGRNLIIKHYSWKGVTNQLLEVYQWMLGHAKRPATVSVLGAPKAAR